MPTLSRRGLLLGGMGVAAAAVVGATLGTRLTATDQVVTEEGRDLLLLRRATFGPDPASVARLDAMGPVAWLTEQLEPATIDTSVVDAKVAGLPLVGAPIEELVDRSGDPSAGEAATQLRVATVLRQVESPAQLHERMVELWSDHFNVPMLDDRLRVLKVVEDREVIRPHAMGQFADLLLASATSPAMLVYLDNVRSAVGEINENYGRELLELHTVGVDGGYDEDDVVATARLLTGWTVDRGTGRFRFVRSRHDGGPLRIMDWERPSGGDPYEHGVQFLDWLAHHPATARTVATRLARRFVTDDPDPALVDHLATTYLAADTAVVPVLRALFTHPAFGTTGPKFRRPNDWLVAAMRATGSRVTVPAEVERFRPLGTTIRRLGQPSFGWPAPDGYPDVEAAWRTAGGLLARWNASTDLTAGVRGLVEPDRAALGAGLAGCTVDEAVGVLVERVLVDPLTNEGRALVRDHSGLAPGSRLDDRDAALLVERVVPLLLSTSDFQYR